MRPSLLSLAAGGALAFALAHKAPLRAQTSPDTASRSVYSHIHLRASGARNVNREQLHEFWSAGTGASLAVTTPFYIGSVGVGATAIPFTARGDGQPNFRALLLGLDWGFELPRAGRLRSRATARVGDFVMLVDNPDLALDSESELFVGGELSAAFPVWRSVAVTAATSIAHVRTRPAIDLALLTLGLEYATRTPIWLRAILE